MRDRLAICAGIVAVTLLGYFSFPGHTFLGSDTQIYVPMLEHIWDPSSLTRDLVATKPHLAYTLYDEIAIALRWVTRSSFRAVLTAEQLLFRALQILGVYLLALSFPLARAKAWLVAALFALGATIAGPAVLTFEYEPVPRGFAIGLLFLAVGLAARNRLMLADVAAALAFLYHPPTVWVFWTLYLWLILRHRGYRDLWPLAAGILLLFASSRFQAGASEPQTFFTRVGPALEELQRMRASYNWVSTWPVGLILQYVFFWIVSAVAFWRVRPKAGRLFLIGMPAIGLASVPLSYLLLDQLKWGLIPQFQPARALLFVTAFAVILAAAAAIRAADGRRWTESVAWFVIVLAVPTSTRVYSISWTNLLLLLALAIALCFVISLEKLRWSPACVACIGMAPFFLLPRLAHVQNYPRPELSGVEDLAAFARAQTSPDAVFVFGDAGTGAYPSIFRAESKRAVYVDWKSGGQMNFSESMALEWWQRWQNTNALSFDPSEVGRLPGFGIDYLVLSTSRQLPDRQPVYQNSQFIAYQLKKGTP